MILGLAFIGAGVLIALYPQLLSLIVSFLLIFIGLTILFIRYQLRKVEKQWENPFIDFFLRY